MNQETKRLILRLKAIQIAESQLERLKARKQSYIQRINQIEEKIDYDSFAIDKLSSNNLFSIYHLLIGRKKESLELIKRHYLQLSIEYNDLKQSLNLIDYEIDVLNRKIGSKKKLKNDIQHAFLNLESVLNSSVIERFRAIAIESEFKIRLAQEISEAIQAGRKINLRFQQASKCIEEFIKDLKSRSYSEKRVATYKVKNIEDYQGIMIKINHEFLMYEVEVNDVYNEILDAKDYESEILTNFMSEYRLNLTKDIRSARDLSSSRNFVSRYQEMISGLNEVLNDDLQKINNELDILEIEESAILARIDSKDL